MVELESAKLISISNLKTDIKPSLSFQKDIKKLTNLFKLIITSLSMFFIFEFTFFYNNKIKKLCISIFRK